MKIYTEPKLEIKKIISLEDINNQSDVSNWQDSEGMDVDSYTLYDANSL